MIEVYHAKNTRDSFFYRQDGNIYNETDARNAFMSGGYEKVGEVQTNNLNKAFELTQNIDKPWKDRTRSTSMGDILIDQHGVKYIVAFAGFDKVDW